MNQYNRLQMAYLLGAYATVFGAFIGSLVNLIIDRRVDRRFSAISTGRCEHCHSVSGVRSGIPVLGYLSRRGRCRDCHGRTSARPPLVELANALFYLAIQLHLGISLAFFVMAGAVSALIALIFIDLQIQILPNILNLSGCAAGLTLAFLRVGSYDSGLFVSRDVTDSIAGAIAGAALMLSIAGMHSLLLGIEGMGLGDAKLVAMTGALCGWQALLPILLLASAAGTLAALTVIVRHGRPAGLRIAIPFGTFIGCAALAVVFLAPAAPFAPLLRFDAADIR